MSRKLVSLLLLITASILFLSSCGRYGPPLPPAAYSAGEVSDIYAAATSSGVTLRWSSPQKDRRGRALTDLTRFDIMRADTEFLNDFLKDPVGESEVVGTVYSSHITLLEEKRDSAREQKLPTRQITIPGNLKQYAFTDYQLEPGRSYIYSIVPYGKLDVPGQVAQFVKVDYIGEGSVLQIFTPDVFERPYVLGLTGKGVTGDSETEPKDTGGVDLQAPTSTAPAPVQ